MSLGGHIGGQAGHTLANRWDQWLLRRRPPDVPPSSEGIRVLRSIPEYTRSVVVGAFACMAFVVAGILGVLFGKPKDKAPAIVLATLMGAFVLVCLIAWIRGVRRRLHLQEWGLEDARSGVSLRWEEIVRIVPLWTKGLNLEGTAGQRIYVGKYMNGLGRLRECLCGRRPELLIPVQTHGPIALHPLEFLPVLPGGSPDPSLSRPSSGAGGPMAFQFVVETVEPGRRIESSPRTLVRGAVIRGTLSVCDWIAPAEGRLGKGTYILMVSTPLRGLTEAREGDRIELQLYESGFDWIQPGAVLEGRSLT